MEITTEQSLHQIVARWRHELTTLSQAWVNAGAIRFGVIRSHEGSPIGSSGWESLFVYPEDVADSATNWEIAVPLHSREFPNIWVGLAGVRPDRAESWTKVVQANTRIIGQLFANEHELTALTAEVVKNQDHWLALHASNIELGKHRDVLGMLQELLDQTRKLTGIPGGFATITTPLRIERRIGDSLPEAIIEEMIREVIATDQRSVIALPNGWSLFAMPLHTGASKDVRGVLGLTSPDPLKSPQIKLVEAIVEQAGTHLENIFYYEERMMQTRLQTEIELAQIVQTRLLPRDPVQIPGMDIRGASHAALEVGGDFFDFIERRLTPFTCVLGDVSGKGLSAALVMTMTRTAIRSAAGAGLTPRSIMEHVHGDLYDDLTELDKFVTTFIAQVDPEQFRITFANAGHAPVIFAPSDQPAYMLEADAPPLGVLPDFYGSDHVIDLPIGAVMIICTDGFVEAENEQHEMFGYEHLLRLVDELKHQSAEEIMTALYNVCAAFRGSAAQGDDQTIIVIKRTNPNQDN